MRAPSFAGSPATASRQAPSRSALLFLRGRDADGRVRELVVLRHGLRPALGALALGLVERRAHEKLGFRSLGDYARERLGLTAHAVREAARVWKALLGLPLLRAAVLDGEVSLSVTRRAVALVPPELDALAVESLRGRTVRAVEAMVAAVRAGEPSSADTTEEPERTEIRLRVSRETAERWHAAVDLARRMAGESLPVWEAAEAVAAETLAALPVEATARGWTTESARPAAAPAPRSSTGDRGEHGLRSHAFPLLRWGSVGSAGSPSSGGPARRRPTRFARVASPRPRPKPWAPPATLPPKPGGWPSRRRTRCGGSKTRRPNAPPSVRS